MATFTKPYGDFVNNVDDVDATKVNAQINQLYTAINGQLDASNVPSLATNITSISVATTITANQVGVIECTAGAGGFTVTLPSATTSSLRYTIKKIDGGAGTITISTSNAQTIDGATTKTVVNQYDDISLVSNGVNWDIISRINKGEAWIAPTLINSWVNFGGANPAAGYKKDELGYVHLEGTIKSGASGTVCFVLPAGYRPSNTHQFICMAQDTSNVDKFSRVSVDNSGGITIMAAGTNYNSLDGVYFYAEQ